MSTQTPPRYLRDRARTTRHPVVSTDELLRRVAAARLEDARNVSLATRRLWNVIVRRTSDAGPMQRMFDHLVYKDHHDGEHESAPNSMCADCLHAKAVMEELI